MQRNFLYIYFFILAFLGCEVESLDKNWQDINTLMVFLSISFLVISSVAYFKNQRQHACLCNSEKLLFLFLIWSAGTFYYSVNPDLTLFAAIKCLGALTFGVGLFLYLEDINQLNRIWLLSFIFAGIHGASGIIERFFTLFVPESMKYVEASESLFANQNYYSCYLLLHVPVGIYLYFKTSSSFSKHLLGHSWIFILVALGLSDSLAAQLIAVLQIFAAIIYFKLNGDLERAKLVGLGALVSFLIYYNLIHIIPGGNALSPELVSSPQVPEGTWLWEHVGVRLRYWLGAWRIFSEHYLIGSGLWTYTELYPYTGLLEMYEQGIVSSIPPHAHNIYLQTAAETGIIGITLFISCLMFLFRDNIKLFIEKRRETLDLNFFALVSTSGFLIHNISEYNWLNSLFVYYFVFLVVSMGYLYRNRVLQIKNNQIVLKNLFYLPFLTFTVLSIGFVLSNYYNYNQIIFRKLPFSQSLDDVDHKISKAKFLCASCGWPHYLSGFARMKEYKRKKNTEFLNEAQKEFSEAIIRNSYNPQLRMLLGDVYTLQGKKEDARNSYKMAMKHPWYTLLALDEIKKLGINRESVRTGPS